jgi:hypothetical protein
VQIGRAFRCFFSLLFRGQLPAAERAEKLPPKEVGPARALPALPEPPRGDAAVQLLAILQRDGRLVDFLQEPIDGYADAQIGAAVRDIHRGCKKVLEEYLHLEPVRPEQEETSIEVPAGFDPSAIRLVGNVAGQPPFRGTLRHRGWRTREVKLPALPAAADPLVIAPAEVELP